MDKSFIEEIDTLVILMHMDGQYTIHVGFEDDNNPPEECVKYVGALLDPYVLEFAKGVGKILDDGSAMENLDTLAWMWKSDTMKITCEYWGTDGSYPPQEFNNVQPMIAKEAETLFLDMLDELGSVTNTLHQWKSPTVEFTVKKEGEKSITSSIIELTEEEVA